MNANIAMKKPTRPRRRVPPFSEEMLENMDEILSTGDGISRVYDYCEMFSSSYQLESGGILREIKAKYNRGSEILDDLSVPEINVFWMLAKEHREEIGALGSYLLRDKTKVLPLVKHILTKYEDFYATYKERVNDYLKKSRKVAVNSYDGPG